MRVIGRLVTIQAAREVYFGLISRSGNRASAGTRCTGSTPAIPGVKQLHRGNFNLVGPQHVAWAATACAAQSGLRFPQAMWRSSAWHRNPNQTKYKVCTGLSHAHLGRQSSSSSSRGGHSPNTRRPAGTRERPDGTPEKGSGARPATRCQMCLRRCRIWSYLVLLTPYSAVAWRGTTLNSPLQRGHKHLFSRSALNCCHLCVCYNTREGVHPPLNLQDIQALQA